MNNQFKTKCNFCRYATLSGCMVMPNSHYCKEAVNEYYQYIRNKSQPVIKSFRKWDRK